jgi:molybdopterin molybdotransferase
MTGAPIPAGVDAVVMREHCDESNLAAGTVRINADAKVGQHIRKRGEDLRAGDVVAARGCRITPARLNAMLAAGRVWARVVRRPRVAIIASGNELREVGESYAPHHVINSNAHAIAAAATLLGCEATVVGIARDALEDHVEWMQAALDNRPDVVITIGGVSMGTHDFVRPALEKLGAQLLSWRVAMRPGKPIAVADVQNTRVFALPGNPVSALVAFELFVAPALRKKSGLTHVLPTTVTRTLAEAVHKPQGLEHYARGQLRGQDVVVLDKQGSHHISALADADVLVRLPQTSEHLDAGASVECIVLPSCRG